MKNNYIEIIGKVIDIIDEVESKIMNKNNDECFNEEEYLLQKIHKDLINLVENAEKRYIEYRSDSNELIC